MNYLPEDLQNIPDFPSNQTAIKDGQYAVKCSEYGKASADDDRVDAQVWFMTPPFETSTISKIKSIRLSAQSNDQGFVNAPSMGNWTWLELVIFEDEKAKVPKVKDGIELVWLSHQNVLASSRPTWLHGNTFQEGHDLLRWLQGGNVIGVRVCARFQAWKIEAQIGYLVINIGPRMGHWGGPLNDAPPPEYKEAVTDVNAFITTLDAIKLPRSGLVNINRADVFSLTVDHALRVLSLDGGGVRGLSTLRILKAIMDQAYPGKNPCDVFDIIGGTSTGGLIAIMLGLLGMSVDECITEYEGFMKKVFPPGKWLRMGWKGQFYPDGPLVERIKSLIKEKLDDDSVEMLGAGKEGRHCKVFVVAVNQAQTFLRSYESQQELPFLPNIKLWEAARATTAAPAYFSPIEVGGYKLIDGGLSANNPLGWLWSEIIAVYGPNQPINCFLSIGTGIRPPAKFPEPGLITTFGLKVQAALADIATNSQDVHFLFRSLINIFIPKRMSQKYWRLTVGEDIPEWDEKNGRWSYTYIDENLNLGELDDVSQIEYLEKMTQKYIDKQKKGLDECVKALQLDTKV